MLTNRLAVAVIRDQILYLVLKILDLVLLVSILYTVSHRSEFTPHIFVNISLYIFM